MSTQWLKGRPIDYYIRRAMGLPSRTLLPRVLKQEVVPTLHKYGLDIRRLMGLRPEELEAILLDNKYPKHFYRGRKRRILNPYKVWRVAGVLGVLIWLDPNLRNLLGPLCDKELPSRCLTYEEAAAWAGVRPKTLRRLVWEARAERRWITLGDMGMAAGLSPMDFAGIILEEVPTEDVTALRYVAVLVGKGVTATGREFDVSRQAVWDAVGRYVIKIIERISGGNYLMRSVVLTPRGMEAVRCTILNIGEKERRRRIAAAPPDPLPAYADRVREAMAMLLIELKRLKEEEDAKRKGRERKDGDGDRSAEGEGAGRASGGHRG